MVLALGGGACLVLGGLVYLGANAEPEPGAPGATASPTATTTVPTTPSDPSPPSGPTSEDNGSGDGDEDDDTSGSRGSSGAPSNGNAPSKGTPPAGTAQSPPSGAKGTKWFCNATGWVRVCGFANVCNNQMVSGMGSGPDQYTASQSAKLACQGMAIAKGGSTVCTVSCTVK